MARAKPKKKAKSRLSRIGRAKKVDDVFSRYIRARDQACVTCGTTKNLQCGHLFSRVAYSTRWHEANAFAQCAGCNKHHNYYPYTFTSFFLNNFGRKAYEELHRLYSRSDRLTDKQLDELHDHWSAQLARLERRRVERVPNYKPPTDFLDTP